MKTDYYIVGLIGIGAIAVIYLLMQENAAAQQTQAPTDENAAAPSPVTPVYPQAAPIQLGNVYIGTTGPNQSYNAAENGDQIPTVGVDTGSDCGCADSNCDEAGIPVTKQTISKSVLDSVTDNLNSFQSKVTSGVEAARQQVKAAPASSQIVYNAA
jgi:outer membrane murein-binding lipoprotein Lpp